MLEHRWSRRSDIDHYALLISKRNHFAIGRIRNLSLYGMYVETTAQLPKNACLQVQFMLPDDHQDADRNVPALVIHQDNQGAGLIINSAYAGAAARIRALLHHCETRHPEVRHCEAEHSEARQVTSV
jgi:hypothetical protein